MPSSATVLLARHGLTAETGSTLTGRTPGVDLDDRGRAQARELGRRLCDLPLDAVVSSPLERCLQTAAAVAEANTAAVAVRPEERFVECDYGSWTGREHAGLAEDPLWPTVQAHPSAVRFPGGESMAEAAHRAARAVRDLNTELGESRDHPVYLVCSHGDIIKSVLADALGLHLDLFQRIRVDPCSISVVHYTPVRPFVERINDTGGTTTGLRPDPHTGAGAAVVGGGAGADDGDTGTEEAPAAVSPPQPPIA